LLAGPSVCEEDTIVASEPLGREDDAFARALEDERRLNVQRLGFLSFIAVSVFFALFLLLGVVLGIPYWAGILRLFGVYWLLVGAFYWLGRRAPRVARHGALSIPLLHMPMIFLLISGFFERDPDPIGPAAFAVGFFIMLVIPAAIISLDDRVIGLTAAVGAVLEIILLHRTGAAPGGTLLTCVLLFATTGVMCSYASRRSIALVDTVSAEQRRRERLGRYFSPRWPPCWRAIHTAPPARPIR